MITLVMKTTRVFKNLREYEDYKAAIKEFMRVDWDILEEDGALEIDSHKPGENVVTRFEIKL